MGWVFKGPSKQGFNPAKYRKEVEGWTTLDRKQRLMELKLQLQQMLPRSSANDPKQIAELERKIGIIEEVEFEYDEKASREMWNQGPKSDRIMK